MLNWFLAKTGRKRYSLSRKIKNSVKRAVKFISDFERTAVELAVEQGYKYVIYGRNHQPGMTRKIAGNATCLYLNSGGWVENLTALEYDNKKWELVYYTSQEKNNSLEEVPKLIRKSSEF